MRKVWLIVAIMVGMLAGGNSWADMIKYTDKDGTMCFVDDLSKVPKQYRKNIVHEVEETDAPNKSDQNQSRQGGGDIVDVCFEKGQHHINGSVDGEHSIFEFMDARGYQYNLHIVTDDPAGAKICYERHCKWYAKNDNERLSKCISQEERRYLAKDTSFSIYPFIAVGNIILGKQSRVAEGLDKYFHVDPASPVKWHD